MLYKMKRKVLCRAQSTLDAETGWQHRGKQRVGCLKDQLRQSAET